MSQYPSALRWTEAGDPIVAGNDLEKARQWAVWLRYWLQDLNHVPNWVRFLRDAIQRWHHVMLLLARRQRGGNPVWDREGGTEEDWMSIVGEAESTLAWLHREKPHDLGPKWAADLYEATEGGLAMVVRLARETEALQRSHGLKCVNVNPRAPIDQFAESA